ncbi:hypothetical protein SFRURICE_002374 [Spodoptera frugiperda]|nr:hypothetical protein SFRURICE_002374 [Spodoptera frugiperda]
MISCEQRGVRARVIGRLVGILECYARVLMKFFLFCYCDKNKTNEYTIKVSLGKLFVIMSTDGELDSEEFYDVPTDDDDDDTLRESLRNGHPVCRALVKGGRVGILEPYACLLMKFCYCDKNKTNEYTKTVSSGKLFVIMSTITCLTHSLRQSITKLLFKFLIV